MMTTVVIGVMLIVFWAGFYFGQKDKSEKCAHDPCDGRIDYRCGGGNCTYHCASISGCYGRCLDAWARSEAALTVASDVMEKARR